MLLDRFNKQPNARKKYEIDFSEWMDEDVAITDVEVTVELLGFGDDDEPTLSIESAQVVGGTLYEYFAVDGTDGKRYKVTFLVTFSDTQVEEWEVEYTVIDE